MRQRNAPVPYSTNFELDELGLHSTDCFCVLCEQGHEAQEYKKDRAHEYSHVYRYMILLQVWLKQPLERELSDLF